MKLKVQFWTYLEKLPDLPRIMFLHKWIQVLERLSDLCGKEFLWEIGEWHTLLGWIAGETMGNMYEGQQVQELNSATLCSYLNSLTWIWE